MYQSREGTLYIGEEIQYSMIPIYYQILFSNNKNFILNVYNMIDSTPVKSLFSSKLSLTTNPMVPKQFTSQELKSQYLEAKLAQKNKKIVCFQQKNQQLAKKIAQLQHKISVKELQLCAKDTIIQTQQNKFKKLETEVARLIQETNSLRKQLSQTQVQEIRQKKEQDYYEKLNKVLTKENAELIAERLEFKKIIQQYQINIDQLGKMLHLQRQNGGLIHQLNQSLQLQVEQLLFQLRMMNRRQQAGKLSEYEDKIDRRMINAENNNKKITKSRKQNVDSNLSQNNRQESGKGVKKMREEKSAQQTIQNSSENDTEIEDKQNFELVELLNQKIINLENHLDISERRCKQLQAIILSK